MKKILQFSIVGVFVSLLILQYLFIHLNIVDLKKSNESLIDITRLQKKDLTQIIQFNINTIPWQDQFVHPNVDMIYLYVNYPVCEACFKGVIHYLTEYGEDRNLQLMVLCDEFYVPIVKKKLLFDNMEKVIVNKLIINSHPTSKMILTLKSRSNNFFYIPLPENRETDFLKAFLK